MNEYWFWPCTNDCALCTDVVVSRLRCSTTKCGNPTALMVELWLTLKLTKNPLNLSHYDHLGQDQLELVNHREQPNSVSSCSVASSPKCWRGSFCAPQPIMTGTAERNISRPIVSLADGACQFFPTASCVVLMKHDGTIFWEEIPLMEECPAVSS